QVLARAAGIQDKLNQRLAAEEQTQQRMLRYAETMRVGRFEDGLVMSADMIQDHIDRGLTVPPAVTAAAYISLAAQHYREATRLRLLREERYLATMLQVELSAVPFPDEPPVKFPPAAQWRELTRIRKETYYSSGVSITDDDTQVVKKIKE